MVMTDEMRPTLFKIWMDRMEDECGFPLTTDEAARLLGKSVRMIRYYEEGREIPRDTLLLMDAVLQGYKPKPWKPQR